MIGDKLILQPYHIPPAQDIYTIIKNKIAEGPYFISIGGESGCGKSTLSIALKEVLAEHKIPSYTFHMDDYFHLPPSSNHIQRQEDISHVGPHEVNLELLQQDIDKVKSGVKEIIKPLIHYKENEKRREILYPSDYKVFIIEGTYVSLLKNIDSRVFMTRTYKDTWEQRVARARDPITPFIEEVLEIEHLIIKKHKSLASIIVDEDYHISSIE